MHFVVARNAIAMYNITMNTTTKTDAAGRTITFVCADGMTPNAPYAGGYVTFGSAASDMAALNAIELNIPAFKKGRR